MQATDVRPKRVCCPKYAVTKARKGKTLNRWELEDLAKDAQQSFVYAKKVLKGRFPEGEAAIAQDPDLAFDYAHEIIKGRFPEAEDTFLKFNQSWGRRDFISNYFIDIVQEPTPRIEKFLLTKGDEVDVLNYAKRCVKGRWKKAENKILGDLDNAMDYFEEVVKCRWPELEDIIIFAKKRDHFEDSRGKSFAQYLEIIGANDEIEEKLADCKRAYLLCVYAMKAVRGKLPPALHQKMMMFSFDPKKQKATKTYLRFLENCEVRAKRYISQLDEDSRKEFLAQFSV